MGASVPAQLPAEMRAAIERDHAATGEITSHGGALRALVAVRIQVEGRTTGYVASAVSLAGVQARVERLAAEHFAGGPDAVLVVGSDFRLIAHPSVERALAREEVHEGSGKYIRIAENVVEAGATIKGSGRTTRVVAGRCGAGLAEALWRFGHHHTRLDAEVAAGRCLGLNKGQYPGCLVALEMRPGERGWNLLGEWPPRS